MDPIYNLIPESERFKLNYGCCELEPDFMGFTENYLAVAENVPENYTIVDLGCYMAAQCYLFRNHRQYIGVDMYDCVLQPDYIPPLRFMNKNVIHHVMTIENFLYEYFPMYNRPDVYWVISAVPHMEPIAKLLSEEVDNFAYFFPGKESVVKGINADKIREAGKAVENDLFCLCKVLRSSD